MKGSWLHLGVLCEVHGVDLGAEGVGLKREEEEACAWPCGANQGEVSERPPWEREAEWEGEGGDGGVKRAERGRGLWPCRGSSCRV